MIAGNCMGGMKEMQEMTNSAAEDDIKANVEAVPMDYVNTVRSVFSSETSNTVLLSTLATDLKLRKTLPFFSAHHNWNCECCASFSSLPVLRFILNRNIWVERTSQAITAAQCTNITIQLRVLMP